MSEHVRPRIYCSRCLEFEPCRFDGTMIRNGLVKALMDHAEFIHDCPEKGIGLGVPRRPVRVLEEGGVRKLVQPSFGLDHTESMVQYVRGLLDNLADVDGLILKSKSPSCGMGDVKVYPAMDSQASLGTGDGFLGSEVKKRFSHLALEDDGRLNDHRIRDHFLTKLFSLARFREARAKGRASDLIDYHTRHKLIIMSLSQSELREMGRTVAEQRAEGTRKAFDRYSLHLSKAFSKGPRFSGNINTLMHSFGYVSGRLSKQEKGHFLDLVEMYRDDRAPLSVCKQVLWSWVLRFDVGYLKDQFYFDPYPLELSPGFDPNRGRELWK